MWVEKELLTDVVIALNRRHEERTYILAEQAKDNGAVWITCIETRQLIAPEYAAMRLLDEMRTSDTLLEEVNAPCDLDNKVQADIDTAWRVLWAYVVSKKDT